MAVTPGGALPIGPNSSDGGCTEEYAVFHAAPIFSRLVTSVDINHIAEMISST